MNYACTERATKADDDTRATWSILAENARLRNLCAQSKELAAQHELALREGNHRIKNSLQIVASLMALQGRRETNPAAQLALSTATARLQAVARIHDALQLSGGADGVDLGALLDSMCGSLQSMAGDPSAVKIVVEAEHIRAPIAVAQPAILAVNELVVNALRHAFPAGRAGSIRVSAKLRGDEFCITVADDGVGLPAGYQAGPGFGSKLVRMLTAKIGGTLKVESESGARFTLTAPSHGLLGAGC
jgi:two-component sensor histidine kinase